jgi:hypothetical protein
LLDAASSVDVGVGTVYTASVAGSSAGPGTIAPSGSVEFLDAGHPIGACSSQPLLSGAATCAVIYGSAGAHAITASYLGDANFTASSSPTVLVQAVATTGLPGSGLHNGPVGTIDATMSWIFYYTPSYTVVRELVVNGAPFGATVLIDCHGRGCPFAAHDVAVVDRKHCGADARSMCSAHTTVFITGGFQRRRLTVGARITVAIVRPDWDGKYYDFTIRARRAPRIQIACLPPGSTGPGGGC